MTDKTKRQLRAEAVERLKAMTNDPTMGDVAVAAVGKPVNGWEWKDALIDMLSDEIGNESTPETHDSVENLRKSPELMQKSDEFADIVHGLRQYANGVRYDYNAIDDVFEPDEHLAVLCARAANAIEYGSTRKVDVPEGDAVAIMRKVAHGDEVTGNAMRKEVGGTDWADALLILADMVERDYVRREIHDAMRNERSRLIARCDELRETLHNTPGVSDELEHMMAERDNAISVVDWYRDRLFELTEERDERKAKAEQADQSHVSSPNGTGNGTGDETCPDGDETCPIGEAYNDGLASEIGASGEVDGSNDAKQRINELEFKLKAVTNACDEYRVEWHRVSAECTDLLREITAQKNKSIELAEQLGTAMAERDEYRAKVGAMLDAAQEIRRVAEID